MRLKPMLLHLIVRVYLAFPNNHSILMKRVTIPIPKTESVNGDFTNIAYWWRQNGLISYHKKCEVMLIGTRNSIATSYDFFLDGKLDGVHIDHNLSRNMHNSITNCSVSPIKLYIYLFYFHITCLVISCTKDTE